MPAVLAALLLAAPASQPATLPVYLGLGGAPASLESRIGEQLRGALEEKGVPLVSLPEDTAPSAEAVLAEARRELEHGVKAYSVLDLPTAIAALRSAEEKAPLAAASPGVAGVIAEARVQLGLIALAQSKTEDAEEHFRTAAALEPERRLDGNLHPPEVVAAYERARRAVLKGRACELTLSSKPAGAKMTVDGRPASGTVRLPYGMHYVHAASETGASGEKVELSQPRALVTIAVAAQPAAAVAALRAAGKRGDDVAACAAADLLASMAGAQRVVLWDLRQQAGSVEAPLRLRDSAAGAFTWQVVADLGTAAAPEVPLRKAVAELLDEAHAAAMAAVPAPVPTKRPPGQPAKALPNWVWWAAGGVALAAAGGAAALTLNGGKGAEDDDVVIVVEK